MRAGPASFPRLLSADLLFSHQLLLDSFRPAEVYPHQFFKLPYSRASWLFRQEPHCSFAECSPLIARLSGTCFQFRAATDYLQVSLRAMRNWRGFALLLIPARGNWSKPGAATCANDRGFVQVPPLQTGRTAGVNRENSKLFSRKLSPPAWVFLTLMAAAITALLLLGLLGSG